MACNISSLRLFLYELSVSLISQDFINICLKMLVTLVLLFNLYLKPYSIIIFFLKGLFIFIKFI